MKKKIGLYLAGLLALAMVAKAATIVYNATLTAETALARDNAYSVDLQAVGVGAMSAQVAYSSATVATKTFGDGKQAVGSFTVLSYAALAQAQAVNKITVTANTAHTNAAISVPGYVFRHGIDWRTGATSAATAESIKLALATVPWLSVSHPAASNIVYATATAGSYYNGMTMVSSDADVVVLTPKFVGGQDNAVVKVNGTPLKQGTHFTAATSNAATATSLASAINTALGSIVTAIGSGDVVYSTSTRNGLDRNYALSSSTPTALSASGALMTGGTDPSYTLGGTAITITSHGLTTALPVLYTQGTDAITNLVDQTTYYTIPLTANTVGLAASKVAAAAGTAIVLASSSTHLTANTYTLAPLAITGIPSFKWQVSNDNSNWFDLNVTSVTMGATGTPYDVNLTNTFWSFGYIGPRYLRLKVIAPTTGGIRLQTTLIGTN